MITRPATPRNSLNIDGSWRLSDTTVVIGDVQYNLDVNQLSTASIGLNVQREDRVRYYVGGKVRSHTLGHFPEMRVSEARDAAGVRSAHFSQS